MRRQDKRESRIRAYHEEKVIKVYENWLTLNAIPRQASSDSKSRYAVGFIDMNLGVEPKMPPAKDMVGLLQGVADMDWGLFSDAIDHLREISGSEWFDDGAKCRESLMNDCVTQNANFSRFIRWQEEMAGTIEKEFGLNDSSDTSPAPDLDECNVTGLIIFFHRHFHMKEDAGINQGLDKDIAFLNVTYRTSETRLIARSKDSAKITRLVGRIDEWGRQYATYMAQIDKGVEVIQSRLERFQSYLRSIITVMRYFPHRLKSECSIERTLKGKRPF